jgi:hypothetical protein
MRPEEIALMAAALTGSLTLLSILTASVGILYAVYVRFCTPDPAKEGPGMGEYSISISSTAEESALPEESPYVCQIIWRISRVIVVALFISAGTALFAAFSLLGVPWSIGLVKWMILLEIAVVPAIGAAVVLWLIR